LAREKKSVTRDKKATSSSPGRTGGAEALQPTFLHLSQALTAENFLPADLVDAYFKRMQDNLGSQFAALLARFEFLIKTGRNPVDIVRDDILPDTNLGPTAKTILLLWYTGGIKNAAGDWEMQSSDQYYRALVWEAIGAHPPTLSNAYYGHWKYPAER
jgi:hypothetical protein